jgi:hypothetical protein
MRRFLFPVFALLLALPLLSQESAPLLAVLPVQGTVVAGDEAEALRQAVAAYVLETGEFRVVDLESREQALEEMELGGSAAAEQGALDAGRLLTAQGFVVVNVGRVGTRLLVSLRLTLVETGQTIRSVADVMASVDELAANLRGLTRYLVGAEESYRRSQTGSEPSGSDSTPHPALDTSAIAGLWSGDRGLERVSISSDGYAVAFFPNGTPMELLVELIEGRWVLTQAVPNVPSFYTSLVPDAVAEALAEVARPMRWVMTLSENGRRLSGHKETTSFRRSGNRLLSWDNSYSRRAVWRLIE